MERGCRNCMWLYHMVTYNPTAPCSECLDHDKWQTTKRTNADRIRAMSDEELAELWWERVDCGECPVHRDCKMTGQDCKKLVLDWLKQEAKE